MWAPRQISGRRMQTQTHCAPLLREAVGRIEMQGRTCEREYMREVELAEVRGARWPRRGRG
eukprot:13785589-Alexandrium_andersonii.AAC.1